MTWQPDSHIERAIARRETGFFVDHNLADGGAVPVGDVPPAVLVAYEAGRDASIAAEEFTPEDPVELLARIRARLRRTIYD